MLKTVLLSLAGVLALSILVVLGVAATKPDTFHIERRAVVAAPPGAVFAQLDDLRRWSGWSPWERLDPTMERTYDGPPRGVGATYAWRGNGDVGAGRMEIVESRPSEKLRVRLEFLEPFEATNMATFTLAPRGDGTEVVWAMDGDNSFIGKVVSVFMDMDALIGQDFERGLESLREVSVTSGT